MSKNEKILSLEMDLEGLVGIEEAKKKPDYKPQTFAVNVIKNVLTGYAQVLKGLVQQERKQFYDVIDCLDKAVTADQKEVSLPSESAGFIRKCFREARLTPNDVLRRVEELVNNMKGYD